jgi:hypothetical protein
VGAYTSFPSSRSSAATLFQHQPPIHAGCTSTNVAITISSRQPVWRTIPSTNLLSAATLVCNHGSHRHALNRRSPARRLRAARISPDDEGQDLSCSIGRYLNLGTSSVPQARSTPAEKSPGILAGGWPPNQHLGRSVGSGSRKHEPRPAPSAQGRSSPSGPRRPEAEADAPHPQRRQTSTRLEPRQTVDIVTKWRASRGAPEPGSDLRAWPRCAEQPLGGLVGNGGISQTHPVRVAHTQRSKSWIAA